MPRSAYSRKYSDFRARLVRARRDAQLTQAALARRLGRPQSFVSKFERGERRLDVVEFIEIARILGLDPMQIVKDLTKPS